MKSPSPQASKKSGFSLIELLIVIAIIGILVAIIVAVIGSSRAKARDTHIKSSVRQLRTIAEIVYDSQGASYIDWSQAAAYQTQINLLLNDIDASYGDAPGAPYITVIRETQEKNFCISAPLLTAGGRHSCIDASGEFRETTVECPNQLVNDPPLGCP